MAASTYSTVFFASALLFNACVGIVNSIGSIVEIPPNATYIAGDEEHRLAYWREDIGLNLHHWHWHQYHPYDAPLFIVDKDRRGELFYYFHEQLMARFNVERICNGLNLVPALNMDEPLPGAYNPMLSLDVAGREWPPRPLNRKLSDINKPNFRDGIKFSIDEMRQLRARVLDSIIRKKVIHANGTEISIDNDRGIEIVGNVAETCAKVSPNENYYGKIGLHNFGHASIGFVHDPQDKHRQLGGVMSEPNTALRDPIFFRWHAFLNAIFLKHKDSLAPYDQKILSCPEVEVTSVEVYTQRGEKSEKEKNILRTYMMKSDINMSRGVDFFPRKPVLVRVTHLNHDEFHYSIEYINKSPKNLLGTVRIFLIPVSGDGYDTIKLSEQRHLAIEMDRFAQKLKPGKNRILRKSIVSSITIPFEQTFRDLDTNRPKDEEYEALDKFNACGCGWPQNLLVPRGTAKGYPMLLFAMITDHKRDWTDQYGVHTENNCKISVFCSLIHKSYPFKLPGGFPFDRPIRKGVDSIQAFLTPNMAIQPVTIFHSDKVRQGRVLSDAKPTILGKRKSENDESYFLA